MITSRGRAAAGRTSRAWRPSLELVATVAAGAASVGAVWQFVLAPLLSTFSGPFEDFTGYAQAAHAVATGVSPYAHFDSSTIVMAGFDYPPLVAAVLRPLDLLSARWQELLWLWLSLASLVGAGAIAARALLPASWPRTRLGVAAALSFPAATYNLWHGQMNPVILLLLAVALSDYVAGRRTRCAVVIGIAASIKLAPVLLLVVLVRRGWWRAIGAATATIAAAGAAGVVALGWPVTRQYITDVLPVLSRDNGWLYNQSWNGVVSRIAERSVLIPEGSSSAIHVAVLVLGLATIAAVWWAVSRGPRTRAERGAEFACGTLAMLLVSSVTWYPVYAQLLIAVAAAVGLAHERRLLRAGLLGWSATAAGVTVAGAAVVGALTMTSIVHVAAGPAWWWFLQACSLPTLAAAGLLVVMVCRLRATVASPAAARAP